MDVTKEQKLKIKFIKSPQFTNEFENLKERKINIYKDIHKTIKKIVEIDTETHNQFFDWLIIVEIYVEIYKEMIYVEYAVKKIDENKINIHLERFANKQEYENSFEIIKE